MAEVVQQGRGDQFVGAAGPLGQVRALQGVLLLADGFGAVTQGALHQKNLSDLRYLQGHEASP
jgi:hypothetical protein